MIGVENITRIDYDSKAGLFIEYKFGDSLQLIKELPDNSIDLVLTDPVWPDCNAGLVNQDQAYELFRAFVVEVPRISKRLLVHLGCDSDPRFLQSIPKSLPFIRVFWLEYVRPYYKGRIMYGSDVAYLFGEPPKPSRGHMVIPGKCVDATNHGKESSHPCPRKINHVQYLVDKCSSPGEVILDPFLGSGTTLLACKRAGRIGIGFEINRDYEPAIKKRIEENQVSIENLFSFCPGSRISTEA